VTTFSNTLVRFGSVDVCRTEFGAGTAAGRRVVLPGDRILVQGWCVGPASTTTTQVTAVVEDRVFPLTVTSSEANRSTFDARIEGLDTLSRPFDLDIIAGFGDGPGLRIGGPYRFVGTAEPLRETLPPLSRSPSAGRIRRLADTRLEPFPPGWTGRRSIRPGAAIEVSGSMLDEQGRPASAVVIEVIGRDYRATLRAEPVFAGFLCVIDAKPLPPGLYDAKIVAQTAEGIWVAGPATAFQIPPAVAEPAPRFLPRARQPAPAAFERFGPFEVARGEPIALEGWACDPADRHGGFVYVAFDDGNPLPIPSRLRAPSLGAELDEHAGFAGIADTADLQPGRHQLRALLLATGGTLWHVLAEREVVVHSS
jgi:hypothetical protein